MKLIDKLILIQNDLKAPKNRYNSFGGYKYRSMEDILEALKPLLKEHNVMQTLTDTIEVINNRVYISATVKVTDGTDTIEVTSKAREPETIKGMSESQITGTASSYARKYALSGLWLIDDNTDIDSLNNKNVSAEKNIWQEFYKSKIEEGFTKEQILEAKNKCKVNNLKEITENKLQQINEVLYA